MSDIQPLSHSPSIFTNFVIPYDRDVSLPDNFEKEGLLKYIHENSGIVNEADSSFFPRAVTDLDIDVECCLKDQYPQSTLESEIPASEKIMEGRNFQPNVLVSNSHQRSGPDGSPSLCSSKSQGFVNFSNLSETGELFAPVRTLTFSDVESSHVEDSYVNTSRLVSTPEHARKAMQDLSYGHFQNRSEDGFLYNRDFQNEGGERMQEGRISNGSNFTMEHDGEENNGREDSPQFRELDGEEESDLLGTGKFKPSFHGIDQEFLDNFTGKNGTPQLGFTGDIFSPLGGRKSYPSEEIERTTPPLHSPAPNSPYAKQLARQGIPLTRQAEHDDNEIQFHMSPNRTSGIAQHGRNPSNSNKKTIMMDYLSENTFQPIDKGPKTYMTHGGNVPRNLNDYFGPETKVTDDEKRGLDQQRYDMRLRQGDGVEVRDGAQKYQQFNDSGFDREFTAMTQTDFEQRYLRRTQVSVKMPQATYDTLTGEFVLTDQARHEPTGSLQDSLEGDEEDNNNENSACNEAGADRLYRSQDSGVITQVKTSRAACEDHEITDDLSKSGSGGFEIDTKQKSTEISNKIQSSVATNSTKSGQSISELTSQSLIKPKDGNFGKGVSIPLSVSVSEIERNFTVTASSQSSTTKQTCENQAPKTSLNQQPISSSTNHPQPVVSQTADQVSSRLLQETISKRNKANQKYVSTVPGVPKTATNQSKEFKKPVDYPPKFSTTSAQGGRKATQGDIGNSNSVKSKLMDQKSKAKSSSTESLGQKQFRASQNPTKPSTGMPGQSYPQAKADNQGNQFPKQTDRSQNNHNQNYLHPDGLGSHNTSLHSDEGMRLETRVVTQVQNTSPFHEHKTSPKFVQMDHQRDQNLDVQGMEEVRSQLQSMLKLSHDAIAPQERSVYEHSEIVAGFGMEMNSAHGLPARGQVDMSWPTFRKPNDEELAESFPSFSSQFLVDSGNASRSDISLHAENQRLRDMLEKERYRRKHCEQYIQQLNMKILETQQQLAVAVSTDKRKDLMIEQLDKQLALVVEGWRKRDAEKEELLENLQQEKNEVENNFHQQQEMISRFENDMSQAVDALRQEREKSSQTTQEMKEKISEAERAKCHAEEMLGAEQEKCQLIQQECEKLREARETMDRKLEQMQRRLHREQDEWFQREQELLQRIEEVGEKNAKILQIEKTKNEEQGKLAEEVVEKLQETTNTVKRLEMELDAALREKESTKVEMGIMEAKFENAQRVLEMDFQAQMEKQIAEQILDVQTRYEKLQDEMRDKHKAQVMELSQRHSKETEKHLGVFREEMAVKEDNFRKQLHELETRLVEYRNENSELKLAKQKLESTRLEILTKLQYAMQSQWNEALSLLVSTPQRKNANRTLTEDENNISTASTQPSFASVNFSLPTRSSNNTPQKSKQAQPAQRLDSPDRTSANQSGASDKRTNQQTPTKEGGAKCSEDAEKDEMVETTALSHMKDFQDYMNRLAETPEWISALTRQSQESESQRSVSNDISLLLSTYLSQQPADSNNQSNPSAPHHQAESSNQNSFINNHQSNHRTSQPDYDTTNQMPFSSFSSTCHQNNSANQVPVSNKAPQKQLNASSHGRSEQGNRNTVLSVEEPITPPREVLYGHGNFTESQFANAHSHGVIFGGMVQSSSPLYEEAGMSRAIAIRPPQQGDDPYIHDGNESVISSISGAHSGGYFQGGQCFSPPTRQRKESLNDSPDDLSKHSNRLNDDYSHLSEKMRKHESHQNDLQKYIQMLLNRPQNESVASKNGFSEQNDSLFSQDGMDLNDTAQAAQLQKELDRIQELRQRQENAGKTLPKSPGSTPPPKSENQPTVHPAVAGQSNILNDEQLSEITRLLNAVKGQPDTGNQHIGKLLDALKDAQKGNQSEVKSTKPGAPRHKPQFTATTKKNVQFHPGKAVEGQKPQPENHGKGDKAPAPAPRSAQSKKMERKIAGSASKGDKGGKPGIWK